MARRFLTATLLVLAACSRAPRDPVRDVLNGTARAAEARDAGAVAEFLSADFRDANGDGRADAVDLLRRTLAGYERISLTLSNVAIEKGPAKGPDTAQAAFKVKMSGKPRAVAGLEGLLPRESTWRFELRLALEKGSWKITSASWSQVGES